MSGFIVGATFEGDVNMMGAEFSIRIIFTGISGNQITTSNEVWTKGFGTQCEVSVGSGAMEATAAGINLNWSDAATAFRGTFQGSNELVGEFEQVAGESLGQKASFVLTQAQ